MALDLIYPGSVPNFPLMNILNGITKRIVNNNFDDVKIVQSWLTGSDVEKALINMRELEAEAEKIKKELSIAKKEVAKAMRD